MSAHMSVLLRGLGTLPSQDPALASRSLEVQQLEMWL